MNIHQLEVFFEGENCFLKGLSLYTNPHAEGSQEHSIWVSGWKKGQNDHYEGDIHKFDELNG